MRNVISFTSTIFMMVILCGTEKARAEDASLPTPPLQEADKVIYGADDRRDIFQDVDPDRREWANSVCALVYASQLTEKEDGTFSLAVGDYTVDDFPPCDDESFRDQPTAAHCTGFIVGPNLIATAGHCFGSNDLENTRFVFGFRMLDSTNARTTFESYEVYKGSRIVTRRSSGSYDYTIIEVYPTFRVPGAKVLRLRTSGTVAEGTQIGVIGHSAGLPMKSAFGRNTVVRSGTNPGYFFANLDFAGAGAGSPVFDRETGLVEGILARGPEDYHFYGEDCFTSIAREDNDNYAQIVSRTTPFATIVQPARGTLTMSRVAYTCGSTVELQLYDLDLAGIGMTEITLSTLGGDSEVVTLTEAETIATYLGAITLAEGTATSGDGVVQAGHGETIVATYLDADTGRGLAGNSIASAQVDCEAPEISNVSVVSLGGRHARIAFHTSEPLFGTVYYGTACGVTDQLNSGGLRTEHEIQLSGLEENTTYFFNVNATDRAENVTTADNEGACFTFTTTDQRDFLTQVFSESDPEESAALAGRSITYTPDGSISGYSVCSAAAEGFPVSPSCGEHVTMNETGSVYYPLEEGHSIPFFGVIYESLSIGEDGYVAFDESGVGIDPLLESHFTVPRISGLFSDLVPNTGEIRFAELDDRIAVTYHSVFFDQYYDPVSFQIEVFYTGEIRITWIEIGSINAIAGLSDGYGLDSDFEESTLSAYPACGASPLLPFDCESTVENDACSDAIPMVIGEEYGGYFHGATGSTELAGCDDCEWPDIWYRFTPLISGEYVFWRYYDFFSVLDIYAGDCGALAPLDMTGYWNGFTTIEDYTLFRRGIPVSLTAGQTYWIRAAGYAGTTGPILIEVEFGAKGSFGCNAGSGAPGNPWTESLIACGLLAFLAWRTRERRATRD